MSGRRGRRRAAREGPHPLVPERPEGSSRSLPRRRRGARGPLSTGARPLCAGAVQRAIAGARRLLDSLRVRGGHQRVVPKLRARATLLLVLDPARTVPTREALDELPPNVKGEIIEGVLYTMTRPRGPHQDVALGIGADLRDPFRRGRGGPGGWWILPKPGIELEGTLEISPDVAGWRRERLPELPADRPITVVPDWVCEILSPTTRRHNLLVKKPYYARVGVRYHWLVDLEARAVAAFHLEQGRWVELGVWGDETTASIPPFDAVPLDVSSWWP
jgi:Uma2 family endonuclease